MAELNVNSIANAAGTDPCAGITPQPGDNSNALATTAFIANFNPLPIGSLIDYEGTIATNGIINEGGFIWLLLDGATIGNALSNATRYANPKAIELFKKLWSNPNLAIFTNAGAISTKGNSATEDFDANKRLALPDPRSRVILTSGTGNGLTARTWGQAGGAETHTLTNAQNAPHDHATPGGIRKFQVGGSTPWVADAGVSATESWNTLSSGGGQPHNNMPPYYCVSAKLILAGRA